MPTAAKKFCSQPGCIALVDRGRCEAHRPKDKRGTRQKKYDRRQWRDRLRPMKLRTDPLCAHCTRQGKVVAASEVNHIDGNSDNDRWENLESLCKPHHSLVTVREHGGFGRKISD